tara:strand:- start:532 stop:822 length:291 start_codon:yes stop_codon:yes gene_type:complete
MNKVMVITQLDDGREHIHAKQNKPEKYNLNDKSDLALISNYKTVFIEKRLMCYNKDLTIMTQPSYLKVNDRVYAKSLRFEPYKDIFIKKRTFGIWQ